MKRKDFLVSRAAVGKFERDSSPSPDRSVLNSALFGSVGERLSLDVNRERRRDAPHRRLVHQFQRLAGVILIIFENPAQHHRAAIRKHHVIDVGIHREVLFAGCLDVPGSRRLSASAVKE